MTDVYLLAIFCQKSTSQIFDRVLDLSPYYKPRMAHFYKERGSDPTLKVAYMFKLFEA